MTVFISHSHEDKAVFTLVKSALKAANLSVWDAGSMTPGLRLEEQLRTAVDQCDSCVFVATARSVERPWCLAELGAFWGAGKHVVIFLADSSAMEKLPPQFHGQLHTEDAERLSHAMQRHECNPSFVERVSGAWWQVVTNETSGSVICHLTISGSSLKGKAWTTDGQQLARFCSQAFSLVPRDHRLYYSWVGTHPFQPMRQLFGIGEITFEETTGEIVFAEGIYSESDENDLTSTHRRQCKYLRMDEREITVMTSRGIDRSELIRKKLREDWF